MNENTKTIIFAVVLAIACGTLLTGMKEITKERQEANKLAFRRENILRVLSIELPEKPTAEVINKSYEANVSPENRNGLEFHKYVKNGETQAIAVHFEGPGLWNKVKGYLALDAEMKIIKGITFYEHEETPGLGGEIEKEWFRNKFVGLPLADAEGKLAINIVKPGASTKDTEIEGISGATITCEKVEDMLRVLNSELKK